MKYDSEFLRDQKLPTAEEMLEGIENLRSSVSNAALSNQRIAWLAENYAKELAKNSSLETADTKRFIGHVAALARILPSVLNDTRVNKGVHDTPHTIRAPFSITSEDEFYGALSIASNGLGQRLRGVFSTIEIEVMPIFEVDDLVKTFTDSKNADAESARLKAA